MEDRQPYVPTQPPLPHYISQKIVSALKIARIDQAPASEPAPPETGGTWLLVPEDACYAAVRVPHYGYFLKHQPKAGGYYVRYADGYESFSPADAFESGNTLAHRWGIQEEQEPKYGIGERGRLVNRSTGAPIPDDEPVFIFRARDRKALPTLQAYVGLCEDADHRAVVKSRILDFEAFAKCCPERMKEPDSNLQELAQANLGARHVEQVAATYAAPAVAGFDLSSDKPLAHKGEPTGNGDSCEVCQ